MATDLDPRTATWTNANMLLLNGDKVTETYCEAIAEDAGFAAYLPRMIAAQSDTLTSSALERSGTFVPYMVEGTYDVYVSMVYTTADSGTYAATLNGTTILSNPSASSAVKAGSYSSFVLSAPGFVNVVFSVIGDGPGNTTLKNSSMFLRFVDTV